MNLAHCYNYNFTLLITITSTPIILNIQTNFHNFITNSVLYKYTAYRYCKIIQNTAFKTEKLELILI